MDLVATDDDSPWAWSSQHENYYRSQWDGEQGKWVTIWKERTNSAVLEDETNLAKAGVVYRKLDSFQEAALQSFMSARVDRQPTRSSLPNTMVTEAAPGDFVYQPITNAQDMRIVQLAPGAFGQEINCTLHVCSVEFEYPVDPTKQIDGTKALTFLTPTFHAVSVATGEPIWYTALSYVWGDPSLVRSILCNGKPFRTTKNLYTALQYLRRTDSVVNLWIDQICINQTDLEEKAQQVILMSKIYQRAWSTIVWLGEEADNSTKAHETLVAVKIALQYHTAEEAPSMEDLGRLDLPSPSSQAWQDLSKLMSRPWFRRLWIIQEAVLSHDVRFLCGRRCIPWNDMSLFAICMADNNLESLLSIGGSGEREESMSGINRIRMIDRMIGYEWSFPRQSALLSVLVEGRGSQATDARDKVFGIVGLTATTLRPDYTLTVKAVYTAAARKILDANSSVLIDLLCCVDHEQPPMESPSWVPDWNSPLQATSLGYNGSSRGIYQATKYPKPKWSFHPNNASLNISGFCFDTIHSISMLAETDLKDLLVQGSPTSQFILECVDRITQHCDECYHDGNLFTAFWKTLVAGKDHSRFQKAPPEYADIFALLFDTATGRSPSFSSYQPTNPKRKLTLANLEVRRPSHIYRQMQVAYQAALQGRRFGITERGAMGLFPRGTRVGDRVCVLEGGHVPFVLRGREQGTGYRLVGECYQHSAMDGQIMSAPGSEFCEIEVA
ncbi:MAG: hypothetical protein Q9211_004508 [Gyalolechia sp. 1 TL-2023]